MKRQIPLPLVIAPVLLLVAVVGYFLLVKPKQDESSQLDGEIAQLETQLEVAAAAPGTGAADDGGDAVTIKVADVLRLTKAMPDEDDMDGILLELSGVATSAGVEFVSIAPQAPAVRTGYSALPINVTFHGNYFDLTDFLFRLRNLVRVRDGKLDADGRLYTLDSLDLHEAESGFPQIEAALTLTAYLYTTTPPAAVGQPPTTTTTSTTTTATTTTTSGEALGGTP